jgi:acetyl-CoA C-acetyltransferase
MGSSTERHNTRLGISRAEQDEFAAMSHQRAALAIKNGLLTEEIVPVPVPQRRGEPVVFDTDEGVRADTSVETLSRLRPSFAADGTITAGSASQISDGGCAVVVMSATPAAPPGRPVLAAARVPGVVAGPDNSLQSQPSNAILRALTRSGLSVDDLDLIEINEAFAAVAIQSMRDLGIGPDIVNVNGGAIALGHPIRMRRTTLALHLTY